MSITYSELLSVALGIQNAKRMRSVTLSVVVSLAIPYFSTLSHKQRHFRKTFIELQMCVLIFSTYFVCNISHSKKNWARFD